MFLKLVFLKKKNVYPLWELSLILSDDIRQKQPPERCFVKEFVLRNFGKIHGNRPDLRPATLLKKRLQH